MKHIINSDKDYGLFEGISTAVFYKFKTFPPTKGSLIEGVDINNYRASSVSYLGNKSRIEESDFIEYGLSYIIEKEKYSGNELLISELDKSSKEFIGKDATNIEGLDNIIVPSQSFNNNEADFDYFGSTLIGNSSLLSIKVPGEVYKVELYEDPIEGNYLLPKDKPEDPDVYGGFIDYEVLDFLVIEGADFIGKVLHKPAITIQFGPTEDIKNNPSSYYWGSIPGDRKIYTAASYRKLQEEVLSTKTLFLYFSNKDSEKGESTKIDISYKIWTEDKNPNRNKPNYDLRNDDYWTMKNSLEIVEKKDNGVWCDGNSGTILGTTEITEPLIYNVKLSSLDERKYSKNTRYSIGDIVELGYSDTGEPLLWESLINNNIGNNPFISPSWISEGKINDYYTNRINVVVYPPNAAVVEPSGTLVITDDTKVIFKILDTKPGYRIYSNNEIQGKHIDSCFSSNSTTPNEDWGKAVPSESDGVINWEYREEVSGDIVEEELVFYDWKEFFGESGITYQNLILNFVEVNSIINLKCKLDGNSLPLKYSSWPSEIKNAKITILGNEVSDVIETEYYKMFGAKLGNIIEMRFDEMDEKSIKSIIATKTIEGKIIKTDLLLSEEMVPLGDGTLTRYYTTQDTVDFNSTDYEIILIDKVVTIKVIQKPGILITDKVIDRVKVGREFVLRFYYEDDSRVFESITISKDTGEKVLDSSDMVGENYTISLDESSKIYTLTLREVNNYIIDIV